MNGLCERVLGDMRTQREEVGPGVLVLDTRLFILRQHDSFMIPDTESASSTRSYPCILHRRSRLFIIMRNRHQAKLILHRLVSPFNVWSFLLLVFADILHRVPTIYELDLNVCSQV
jgi:hypothetical protein